MTPQQEFEIWKLKVLYTKSPWPDVVESAVKLAEELMAKIKTKQSNP